MNRALPDELARFDDAAVAAVLRGFDVARRWHRYEVRGLERVPEGPAILVGNHNGGVSAIDGLFLTEHYRARGLGDRIYVLTHDLVFRFEPLARRLNRIGMIRTSALNARAVLQAGHKLLVFPGGDRESLRPFARRKEVVHPGSDAVARMALAFDAPLVPLVSAGGHESFVVLSDGAAVARALGLPRRFHVNVMPTALALPWGLVWGPGLGLPYLPLPAKVTAEVGEAIAPAAWRAAGAEALTDHVFGAMQSTLDRLYAERRWPVIG